MSLNWDSLPKNSLEPVLKRLGFRYDPFRHVEASGDPHLGEYIVGHEIFAAIAWNDAPAFIFAPAGGGKTTLRIYTARSCWIGLGGAHPFPIVFVPTTSSNWTLAADLWRELARNAASALLMGLAFRPEQFLRLAQFQRRKLAALLDYSLSGPLAHYIDVLRQTGSAMALVPLIERAYTLPDPPSEALILELCDAFESAAGIEAPAPLSPEEHFQALVHEVTETLEFSSIFILIDGLDALPETSANAETSVTWLKPLLAQSANWAAQRIFLKCFLPLETQPLLAQYLHQHVPQARQVRLEWTPDLLAELIRRRIHRSTNGEIGGLDAFSGPGLRDVETTLVKAAPRIPREVLVLVRRVLYEYAQRTSRSRETSGYLEQVDVETALTWYASHPVWLPEPYVSNA